MEFKYFISSDARARLGERFVEDQGWLRKNMKALRGSAEEKALLQRYTKQLDEQEIQLDALQKKSTTPKRSMIRPTTH